MVIVLAVIGSLMGFAGCITAYVLFDATLWHSFLIYLSTGCAVISAGVTVNLAQASLRRRLQPARTNSKLAAAN